MHILGFFIGWNVLGFGIWILLCQFAKALR